MYHVSKDKRAVKSAELIWQGLKACMKEKEIKRIRVADINEKSYISRATFYRLFDSVEDVLAYECDLLFEQMQNEVANKHFPTSRDLFLFFIRWWIDQKELMMGLSDNHLTHIIFDAHMRHADLVKAIIIKDAALSKDEEEYLVSILSCILPAVTDVWCKHGQKESAETIYRMVIDSLSVITGALNEASGDV